LRFGIDAALIDALHAVGALFHDAAAAHADVRVAHHLVLRRVPILEEQEIKPAHLIWTVVLAVARADAPVVDHIVQAFRGVAGRGYRANNLARRVLALHARDWLEIGFRIVAIALVVDIDANPVHVTPEQRLVLADHRDVIFRLTREDAVVASHALVEVDQTSHTRSWGREFLPLPGFPLLRWQSSDVS